MISKQYLCFAACLQVAAKETANVEIDQVVIANHLGVALPIGFDCSALVEQGVTNLRFDSDSALWGIEPVIADIDRLLKQAIAGFECRFEPISTFQDWEFEERIAALTESGQFPIVGFEYNALFGESATEMEGHCAVVYRIRKRNGQSAVEIYDPGPKDAGFRNVDSYTLYCACRKKHAGIWLLAPVV
jgi:hypothetical protein